MSNVAIDEAPDERPVSATGKEHKDDRPLHFAAVAQAPSADQWMQQERNICPHGLFATQPFTSGKEYHVISPRLLE